ncbi:hypothetical protein E4H12_13490 [Candidatus Thorarchaeota archaeon]|nr:MAG: hypothetical protein E4H12_13490 [Candidatus Thorarchaeota archaeon]
MIYGEGISKKYTQILEARAQELLTNVPEELCEHQTDKLMEFKNIVRNCSHDEFEEWYQLYKDTIIIQPKRKRKRKHATTTTNS